MRVTNGEEVAIFAGDEGRVQALLHSLCKHSRLPLMHAEASRVSVRCRSEVSE